MGKVYLNQKACFLAGFCMSSLSTLKTYLTYYSVFFNDSVIY